jgi:hypothetical protein
VASKKGHYHIYEMDQAEFIDFKILAKILIQNKEIGTEGNFVNWLKVSWFTILKGGTPVYFLKCDKSEPDFCLIESIRRGLRKPSCDLQFRRFHRSPMVLKEDKMKDLKSELFNNCTGIFYKLKRMVVRAMKWIMTKLNMNETVILSFYLVKVEQF